MTGSFSPRLSPACWPRPGLRPLSRRQGRLGPWRGPCLQVTLLPAPFGLSPGLPLSQGLKQSLVYSGTFSGMTA